MIKGVRLNKLFNTEYVIVNNKFCIKNCKDWVAIDEDKNEIVVNSLGNILFFNSKSVVEQTGDFYKNRISISNLKGVNNLIKLS
ncbi:hypothetical protein DAC16_92 [Bacteroides phage DAC16]|nr:hypothetical protein DAC16_92 [Bacteroides phage DAC16]QIG64369.1 hypothetical protein DAC23_91 [Bacteroides phage DAC23]